jgi:RHS repeat-associated protein
VSIATRGTWSNAALFKETTDTSASLKFTFMVNLEAATQPEFTFGTGPDHGIFDVYIGGSLWQSFDGYAATAGERTVFISLSEEGPLSFEIRTRAAKNLASTGYKARFKQLLVSDAAYDLHTIQYQYDMLSRLLSADYYPGTNVSATPLRSHAYTFDLAGNRLSESLALNGGAPTVTNYTYNAANQISNNGFSYDNNGNLTSDGTNTYVWDRANRLLSMGGVSYTYDGMGHRVSRTASSIVTQYLLDTQPGLAVVLGDSDGNRYVHAPHGIHSQQDSMGNWQWMTQDGLGSVRSVADNNLNVLWTGNPEPFGIYFGESGARQSPYLFTGEYTDPITQLVHLRARDYNPALGVFPSLDPFEGTMQRPMSLNGYSWVEGNVVNSVDKSGLAPTIEGIENGDYEYSCRCGWLDWGHIGQGDTAYLILENIDYAAKNSSIWHYWGVYVRQPVLIPQLSLFEDVAVVPDQFIKPSSQDIRKAVATSIYMSANEIYETRQGIAGTSSFSEEDLPSNLIGMYVGFERYIYGRRFEEDIKKTIRSTCRAFGKQASKDVFRETYNDGRSIVQGWRSWYPRILTLMDCSSDFGDLSSSPEGNCNGSNRQFPTIFSSLLSAYIAPQVGGNWWWQGQENNQAFVNGSRLRTYVTGEIRMSPSRIIGLLTLGSYELFLPQPTPPTGAP